MTSDPSTFSQIGAEAMNNGYFMAGSGGGGGMSSADVTPFHPSMLLEHFGFGLDGSPAATGMGAQFPANSVTLASFASQLFATAPTVEPQSYRHGASTPPEEEEMDGEYGVAGGDSCSAASLRCHGQPGAIAVWPSSSSKTPYGSWSSADRSRTVSVCEPYLAGIPGAAGFPYPLAACSVPSAPARSELSLTLCSNSSADSALNAGGDQCSSVASRSALTELPYATPARFDEVVAARSRYAAAAQEVLNDLVCRLLDGVADAADSGSGATPLSWSVDASSVVSSNRLMASSEDGGGARWGQARLVRSDLLRMLQMLDQKYNQCLDEVQSTTAKFNALMQQGGLGVGSVGNASICAPFAHRAVSAMYRGLRRRIEVMAAAAASRPTCWGKASSVTAGGQERSVEAALIQKHWVAQQLRRGELQCWRPQRGLPERSVAVLKAWMFEHFLKPYPDDHEKDMLAARSGLTRSQVSNWFINARVRIWKPMIEEMYQDLKRGSAGEQRMEMEPQQSNMLSA